MPIETVLTTVLLDGAVKVVPAILAVAVFGALLRRNTLVALIGLAVLFVADFTILRIGDWWPAAQIVGPGLNWDGKIYSVLLGLTILALLPAKHYAAIGMFQRPSPTLPFLFSALIILFLARCAAGAYLADRPIDWGAIAYQATMPGLDEEIFYRGIYWVWIAVALDSQRFDEGRFPWAAFLITTGLFAWVHAAGIDESGAFYFNQNALWGPLIAGTMLGAIQGLGRALWIPILLHNLANVAVYL